MVAVWSKKYNSSGNYMQNGIMKNSNSNISIMN